MIHRNFTRAGDLRKRSKAQYRTRNWAEYEKGLESRGDFILWIPNNVADIWYEERPHTVGQGRPPEYSDAVIELMLVFRVLDQLPQRQAKGRVRTILSLLGLGHLKIPSRRTINRRIPLLNLKIKMYSNKIAQLKEQGEPVVLALDSTGLKVVGEYEWCNYKHGGKVRKAFRKLHIGVCNKQIVSFRLTTSAVGDKAVMHDLINEAGEVDKVAADGGYHTNTICDELKELGITGVIPPPVNAVVHNESNTTINDANVNYIKEKGRDAWRVKHDHGQKEQAENTFYRIKRHNKGKMLHKDEIMQRQEGAVLCSIMNKFQSVAWPQTEKIC